MEISNEEQVIKEIINGEPERFRLLVNRYAPMVFHIVRRFEKDEIEIEEIAQQIFVNAYERLDSYKRKSKFSTWLYRLAMNYCMDYLKNIRRNNVRLNDVEQGYLEELLCDSVPPYQHLEVAELQQLLNKAIGQLEKEYSEPFLLKYRDGLSYDVISERLGVSVGALKVRAHRARKELKTFIEKSPDYYG